jgi:tetratricopeptide (TPR) repeat protein
MLFYLKFIFTRTIVFYLVCFLLVWRLLDYHQLMGNGVPQTMSRLTPPIDYFAEFVDKKDHYDSFKLLNCIYYHKAVAHFFPFQKAESYGMLGFCYERMGQVSQAIASYKEAIAANPDYFWPYYNLGVIFYRKAQYLQAHDYFQQAIKEGPIKTIILSSKSKVFNDVRLSKQSGSYNFSQGVKEGYVQAYILMMESLYKLGNYTQLAEVALNGLNEGLDVQGIFYYYAGVAAFNLKSYPKAIDLLEKSLQINPNNPEAFLYMGFCLKIINKIEMAQAFIDKASLLHQQGASVLEEYLSPAVRFF